MAEQNEVHSFLGMVKDVKESLMEPKYYIDAHNIRITTREDNPLQYIVTNEKGTVKLPITIPGIILGYCVVANYLVTFSTTRNKDNKGTDYIYRVYLDKLRTVQGVNDVYVVLLFKGDLNFRLDKPIETLGSYEDKFVCKVYWTDGFNQPRIINILKPELKGYDLSKAGLIQELPAFYTADSFNFIRELLLKEQVSVERVEGGAGMFAPGVILYAFTYYNKYELESNIFYTTPLYYTSFPDRGGNGEDRVANSFKIKINNIDLNFEYLRVYSIQRTSKDDTPIVKRVADINISNFKNNDNNKPFYEDYFKSGEDFSSDTNISLLSESSTIKEYSQGYFTSNAETIKAIYTLNNTLYVKYFKDNNFSIILKNAGLLAEYTSYNKNYDLAFIDTFGSTGLCLYGSIVKYYAMNPVLSDGQLTKYKNYLALNEHNLPEWFPVFTGTDDQMKLSLEEFIGSIKFNILNYNFIFNSILIDNDGTVTTKYNNMYIIKEFIANGGAFNNVSPFMGICTNNSRHLYYDPTFSPSSSSSSSDESYYLVTITDTGMIGDTIDSQRLLYVGGETITAQTLDLKDGTMFLGNLSIVRPSIRSIEINNTKILEYLLELLKTTPISSGTRQVTMTITTSTLPDKGNNEEESLHNYVYKNSLYTNTSGFKSNEYYRLGILFLYKTGKWSDPIYLDDIKQEKTPYLGLYSINGVLYIKQEIPIFKYSLPRQVAKILYDCGYRKARGVVVFPKLEERSIIALGVVNPTMYTKKQRETSLYALSSWFFRPIYKGNHVLNMDDIDLTDTFRFGVRTEELKSVALEALILNTLDDDKIKSKTGGVVIANYSPDAETRLKYVGNNYQNRLADGDSGDSESSSSTEKISIEELAGDIPTRDVEIQGCFSKNKLFYVDWSFLTFHSPDIQFDDLLYYQDYNHVKARQIGYVKINTTYSDISLITKTGEINAFASGFDHRSFAFNNGTLLCSGLFYEDGLVNENKKTGFYKNADEYFGNEPFRFMIYPFQRLGSINNDSNRSSSSGEGSSKLKSKIISNLRIGDSYFAKLPYSREGGLSEDSNDMPLTYTMQLDYFDLTLILKFDTKIYQSNIDSLLVPDYKDGNYFISSKLADSDISASSLLYLSIYSPGSIGSMSVNFKNHVSASFYLDSYWHKTWDPELLESGSSTDKEYTILSWYTVKGTEKKETKVGWVNANTGSLIGDSDIELTMKKSTVSMKYKSTPHMVLPLANKLTPILYDTMDTPVSYLPIVELYRDYDNDTEYFSKDNLFGGKSEDALKANKWYPAGGPVIISSDTDTTISYDYGDTWYLRFDCLKTYAFTLEDENQIVDILSFPCETRVNIDGRYDRNRGLKDNTTMTPTNFNLLNSVYSLYNNYFTYFILDDDYYKINTYPNLFTWTLEKHSGEEIDPWTNITLASTYDVNGSKGEIRYIDNWSDNLVCFLDRYISRINFNALVQVETVLGDPIEIINSKRVNGVLVIGDNIGSINKFSICNSANAIYFIDSMTNNLWKIEGNQQMQASPISLNVISTWFNVQKNLYWTPSNWGNSMKLYFDDSKKDLYIVGKDASLCYNASINAFTSFLPYNGINCLFNYNDNLYAIRDASMHQLCIGEYNSFFGEYIPFDITFLSNGYNPQYLLLVSDKIFDIIETRADYYLKEGSNYTLQHGLFPFDSIKVWNNYLDTTDIKLLYKKILPSNLKKKFRIWRILIPRDNNSAKSKDRIRDVWCKIKLQADPSPTDKDYRIEMNDLIVKFFV